MIILRIAVRGPDETPVRAPKALVLILEFLFWSNVVQLICKHSIGRPDVNMVFVIFIRHPMVSIIFISIRC